MDLLARIEPVARPLLQGVDQTLDSFGAPADHAVWGLLRRVGALPADAVALVAATAPGRVRDAGARLRAAGGAYPGLLGRPGPRWHGQAGQEFADRVDALGAQVEGELGPGLSDTGEFLDDVAAWQDRARRAVAGVLATVLASADAVTLRQARVAGTSPAAGAAVGGAPEVAGPALDPTGGMAVTPSASVVKAAADIAAHVLGTVAAALDDGEAVLTRWAELSGERGAVPNAGRQGSIAADRGAGPAWRPEGIELHR